MLERCSLFDSYILLSVDVFSYTVLCSVYTNDRPCVQRLLLNAHGRPLYDFGHAYLGPSMNINEMQNINDVVCKHFMSVELSVVKIASLGLNILSPKIAASLYAYILLHTQNGYQLDAFLNAITCTPTDCWTIKNVGIITTSKYLTLFYLLWYRVYVWWYVNWSGRAERSTCYCKEYINRMGSTLVCFMILILESNICSLIQYQYFHYYCSFTMHLIHMISC